MSLSDIIRIPFGYLLEFLYNVTSNYGVALILFSVIVKLLLMPTSVKTKRNSMKMSRLSPQLKELERKYSHDKTKYQQAVQKLYQEEGISAGGGCLWSLLPLFILLPLYQVIRQPMVYMMHVPQETTQTIISKMVELGADLGKNEYYHQMIAASKLSDYMDKIPEIASLNIDPINFSFFGLDLSSIPQWRLWTLAGWAAIGLFLIPLISGGINWLSMWISQRQNNSVATNEKGEQGEVADAAASSMKSMMLMMPIMSIWIGYSMPASMSIYWIANGVLGMASEWVLAKYLRKAYDAEDEIRRQRAAERAAVEAERERIRAERRANGELVDNTRKKKLKAREKAEKAPAIEGKLTPEERAALKEQKAAATGGDPERPYCRGRDYVADRYGKDGEELVAASEEEVADDYMEPEEIAEESAEISEESEATEE